MSVHACVWVSFELQVLRTTLTNKVSVLDLFGIKNLSLNTGFGRLRRRGDENSSAFSRLQKNSAPHTNPNPLHNLGHVSLSLYSLDLRSRMRSR